MVPAIVDVGVSYLNDPKQVSAILVKVGKRAMNEVVDGKGRHLIRQIRLSIFETTINPVVAVTKTFMLILISRL